MNRCPVSGVRCLPAKANKPAAGCPQSVKRIAFKYLPLLKEHLYRTIGIKIQEYISILGVIVIRRTTDLYSVRYPVSHRPGYT